MAEQIKAILGMDLKWGINIRYINEENMGTVDLKFATSTNR